MSFILRNLGICDYMDTWNRMKGFTGSRNSDTADEIWLLQHNPVYTQGTSCREEPRARPVAIPVVHSNRGGQITYHGPGQLVVYLLLDLKRRNSGPRFLVNHLEQIVIDYLGGYEITANRISGAPGVYVEGKKIAALGLRISRGCTYHGLCINIDMDLSPFDAINPCGFEGLEVTQLRDYYKNAEITKAGTDLVNRLEIAL
jgi:lipoyl(octanoyl) transferase